MLFPVNRLYIVLPFCLISPLLAQKAPSFPVQSPQIFPNLSYGPNAWSLLRLTNPSAILKSVRVDAFRADGQPVPLEPVYTVPAHQSVDVRIQEHTTENEYCWARVEDVSKKKSNQPLEVGARAEQIAGDTLQDFPQYVSPVSRSNRWVSPSSEVMNRQLFFLNTSSKATELEICSVNRRQDCAGNGAKAIRATVNPRQSIVLSIGTIRKSFLLIKPVPAVPSIIGLMSPESPRVRKYSAESSISFDEPQQP